MNDRSREIAHEINAHLPEAYQAGLLSEDQRVHKEVLVPASLSARKILIIGGAGYIGTILTEHLLSRGYLVRSFDAILYNNGVCVIPFINHENYEFYNGDYTKSEDLKQALKDVTDVVLSAGLVGDPITKKYPGASEKINDDGYETILQTVNNRGLNKVIFVSTCSNYGLIEGDQLANEDFELNPLSLYAKSKVQIEKNLLGAKGKIDYTPTVLRFATAFGLSPRMRFDLTISEFTRDMFLGKDLLVFDADTWRPYCHIRDFAELIRRTLEAPVDNVAFDVFNAGGEQNNFTKQMIVDAILKQLPEAQVRYQEHGADPRNYRVDFSKIQERLLFEPAYAVKDGIRELIAALQQGLFRDISQPTSFHGNWEINYPG